jgi:CxxC-x17-CxxC domain-containing protein
MDEDEGEGGRPERKMYDAVCAKCGQPCQVPFQPAEGRPVYCRNCYRPRRPRY